MEMSYVLVYFSIRVLVDTDIEELQRYVQIVRTHQYNLQTFQAALL